MPLPTREQLYALGPRITTITIPEWTGPDGQPVEMRVKAAPPGLKVRMRAFGVMCALGKTENLEAFEDLYVDVAIACCVTHDGSPFFIEENRAWLRAADGAALERIFDAAGAIAMTDAAAVEAAKQDFSGTRSSATSSPSPSV
ncbi:MAG TPA: hypothetical protein VF406_16195 [Thermodesulfobacteriota bacterium]